MIIKENFHLVFIIYYIGSFNENKYIFFFNQSISPGFVDTKMIEKFKFEDNTVLQTIDIADAIVYALSAPKRVNVSLKCIYFQLLLIKNIHLHYLIIIIIHLFNIIIYCNH